MGESKGDSGAEVVGMTRLGHPERRRVYQFPDGQTLVLYNVTHIEVRPSGKHRVQCEDGRKLFVNTGWLWIEIDTDEWSL